MKQYFCLCCAQPVKRRGNPLTLTPERAARSYKFLLALGYTREQLLGEHRENLDYTTPGLTLWIETNTRKNGAVIAAAD
jgi:hypothetical protein